MNTRDHNHAADHSGRPEGAQGLSNPQGVDPTLKALQELAPYMTRGQWHALWQGCQRGEEQAHFRHLVRDWAARIAAMPRTYETDGQGLKAIAVLHYFTPAFDYYVTEKDRTGGTQQAFGLACAHEREIGYISIRQLVEAGAELDLHWVPKTLAEIGR